MGGESFASLGFLQTERSAATPGLVITFCCRESCLPSGPNGDDPGFGGKLHAIVGVPDTA